MKKILLVIISIFLLFNVGVLAYTDVELEIKKNAIKPKIEKILVNKISKFSDGKKQKLIILIDSVYKKYEKSSKLSDNQKLIKLSILLAVREIVS